MEQDKVDRDETADVTGHLASKRDAFRFLRDPRVWRDLLVFSVGLLGVIHELFFTSVDRPAVLFLCAGMIGVAALGRSTGDGK